MKAHYNDMKDEIAKKIIDMTGCNVFKNTRERKYSDARSLLIKILVDDYNMGWTEIAKYFTEKGKPMTHASIIHLYKSFPSAVLRTNDELTSIYNHLMNNYFLSSVATENLIDRIRKVKHPRKFEIIEKCLDEISI
jgi:hypothetical protein